MTNHLPIYPRILAIVPSPSGFGMAVVEGINTLVDWDAKRVREDLNNGCMARIEKVIAFFEPQALVLEDGAGRSKRVRALLRRISALARKRGIQIAVLSKAEVRQAFFSDGKGSKDALAKILAERFPEELGQRLPPTRRAWMSEDHRIPMFMAVALALAFGRRRRPDTSKSTATTNS